MKTIAALALSALGILLAAGFASAQATDFCELKSVKVETVSNGVRLRLQADGLIQFAAAPATDVPADPRRLSFLLSNVRGAPEQTVMVAKYPVSHLEFAVPIQARQGVGIICTVVLYRPGTLAPLGSPSSSGGAAGINAMVLKSQDQNELLVMITSDRPQTSVSSAPRRPAPSVLEVSGSDQRVFLRAMNAPAAAVVERLSEVTGVPILLENAVGREISAALSGLPLHQVLTALTGCYGLDLSWQQGHYVVSSGLSDTGAAYGASQVRRLQLSYLSPDQAMAVLPEVALPFVRPDVNGNALVASGPGAVLDKLQADLRALDRPSPQCEVRTWVVTASANDTEVRQIMARASGEDTQGEINGLGHFSLSVGTDRAPELLAQLRALVRRNRAQLRTTGSLVVANGQWGELFSGARAYYWRLLGRRSQRPYLMPLDVGQRVTFAPRTGGDAVTAWIAVEDNSLQQTNDLGPLVMRRRASATVRLLPGQTLILGGLENRVGERVRSSGPPAWPFPSFTPERDDSDVEQNVWILLQARVLAGRPQAQADQPEVVK